MNRKVKMSRRAIITRGLGLMLGWGLPGMATNAATRKTAEEKSRVPNRLHSTLPNAPAARETYYDVVVIGSGYGASVMAARLAPQVKRLAVFERGREWLPGDFPQNAFDLARTFRSPVNPLALVEVNAAEELDIFCGNGLGGTSLLNAAIAIRPEPNVFAQSEWPTEIQQAAERGVLESYYRKAEGVLRPMAHSQIAADPKSKLHRAAALHQQRHWAPLPLNINRENYAEGINAFGARQYPCTDCGDCCSGCNVGAKNTLATNYLPLAKQAGAAIYTQYEALSIAKNSDGNYTITLRNRNGLLPTTEQVIAKHLILGAGSMGSTAILLRSQSQSLTFSATLGSRLSANGDVMGLAYNGRERSDILGLGARTASVRPGPALASYIDYRANIPRQKLDEQFLLLDGVVPSPFRGLVSKALASYALTVSKQFSEAQLKRIRQDLAASTVPEDGALNHSMLYFACGHDSAGGRYFMPQGSDSISARWPGMSGEESFRRIDLEMKSCAELLGARYIRNPRSTIFGGKLQVTHPLGGCPMGRDVDQGVVDHRGRVYARDGGVHKNLYVVDAAIIPRSLAAPPLLTITALAERIADLVVAEIKAA